jgi:hypothetical protein
MRASRCVAVSIAVAAIFMCWCNSVHAGPSLWPINKGEICFNNKFNGEFVRLAVMRTVGNNYIVQGFVTEESGSGHNSLLNGNAIVEGDKILMNVSVSGHKGDIKQIDEVYGSIGRVELNASDLTGWVVGIDVHCEPPSFVCVFSNYSGSQELEPTPCH